MPTTVTTYPLATLSATISSEGVSVPSYNGINQSLKALFQQIYGSDIYVESDSQDGQLIGIIAQAVDDTNMAIVDTYNSLSPSTAQGAALSSRVKINGIMRDISSFSVVELTIVGQANTPINNGIATDGTYKWDLPATVTIPTGGSVTVQATCETAGAINALPNTITKILTPTRGWQTVNNAAAAIPGNAVETDAALRARQAISTGLPSQTVMEAIVASVAAVKGVIRYEGFENDTGTTDVNGIPAHSISIVVEGGTDADIATAIADKKTPGTGTYGTTSYQVIDSVGIPNTINFYRPTTRTIQVTVNATALTGYVSSTGTALIQAVSDYINSLAIGEDVYLSKIYVPANLNGSSLETTYNVTSITIGVDGGTQSSADIPIAFNEVASSVIADITLVVT
jgi:uncharacterized phage protein gp47/JayE